jgi:hypothetical protein
MLCADRSLPPGGKAHLQKVAISGDINAVLIIEPASNRKGF